MRQKHRWSRLVKPVLYAVILLLIILFSGLLLLNGIITKKIKRSLQQLPAGVSLSYSEIHTDLLRETILIDSLDIKYTPVNKEEHQQHAFFQKINLSGIGFFRFIRSQQLVIRDVMIEKAALDIDRSATDKKFLPDFGAGPDSIIIERVEWKDVTLNISRGKTKEMSLHGKIILKEVTGGNDDRSGDHPFHVASIDCLLPQMSYEIPGAYTSLIISGVELNSLQSFLHIDSCRILPHAGKFDIGRIKGHQVDYCEGSIKDIRIDSLAVMQLLQRQLIAGKISVANGNLYVFRDRRLPLRTDIKPMPMADLDSIPLNIRVHEASVGSGTFIYEEYPKDGNETGILKILHLHMRVSPLINRPIPADPEYIDMKTSCSLMGSGIVTADMRLPLRGGKDYLVNGAFHDLDLTKLNASAENLGKFHIESGMLNSLYFGFDMTEEKSTGKIIGEYHDLVIDKLKKGSGKKTDKLKSFFLKKLIIPKNKDKSMPEAKRTGKVDYPRDPERYFSFYLLHSLLTGIKSSFSLGFLLPG